MAVTQRSPGLTSDAITGQTSSATGVAAKRRQPRQVVTHVGVRALLPC